MGQKCDVVGRLFLLLSVALGVAMLVEGAMTDLSTQICARQSTQQTQNLFDLSCNGTYPSNSCQDAGDRLFCDDTSVEMGDNSRQGSNKTYAGVKSTFSNSSILNCASIKAVSLCYKMWCSGASCTGSDHTCTVGVDANDGSSWNDSAATCVATEDSAMTCINVTGSENWNCTQFFGVGTTRAIAKAQAQRSVSGTQTWSFDVLLLNVTYMTVDTVKPSVGFVDPTPANNTFLNTSSATINISATDDNALSRCTLTFDGVNETMTMVGSGASVTCNTAKASLAQGVHTFKVYVNDTSNNENQTSTRTFTVDTLAPAVNVSVNTSSLIINRDSVNISWFATDTNFNTTILNVTYPNGTLLTQTTNSSGTIFYSPSELTALGTYFVRLEANDSAGNTNQTNATFTVSDTEKPSIDFVDPTPANNSFLNSTDVTINVTAANGVAISICTLTFDGVNETMTRVGSGTNVTCNTTKTSLAQGAHTFKAYVNDSSNNENQTGTRTITVDTILPSLNLSTNDSSLERGIDSLNLSWRANDSNLANVTLNVTYPNGTLLTQTTNSSGTIFYSPAELTALGKYLLRLQANDSAGNTNQTNATFTVSDTLFPTITFVSPTPENNTFFNSSSIVINISATDNGDISFCTLTFDGVNETMTKNGSGTSVACNTTKTSLTQGTHTFKAYVNDSSSNENQTGTRTVTVDTILPSLNLSLNDSSLIFSVDSINLSWLANDSNLANVTLNVTYPNGTLLTQTTNSSGAILYSPSELNATGTYLMRLQANDSAGNMNQTSVTFTVSDIGTPTIDFVDPTPANNTYLNSTSVNINLTATNGVAISICTLTFDGVNETMTKVGSGASVTCNTTKTSLGEGTHTFKAYVNDSSSNENQTETRTVTVDTILPSLNISLNDSALIFDIDSLNLSWRANDSNLANVTLNVTYPNGTLLTQTTNTSGAIFYSSTELTALGTYLARLEANDSAGNTNQTNTTFTVSDIGIPTINFVSPTPANNTFLNSTTAIINVTVTDNFAVGACTLTFDDANQTMTANGSGTSVRCNATKTSLAQGNHSFIAYVNDSSGNENKTQTQNFTVDTIYPSLNLSLNDSVLAFEEDSINITWQVNDSYLQNTTLNITYPNGTLLMQTSNESGRILYSPAVLVASGTYLARLEANDSAGNKNQTSTTFLVNVSIDETPPLVSFVNPTPENASFVNTTFTINISVSDAVGVASCTLNFAGINETMTFGVGNTSCAVQKTGVADGAYQFQAYANDSSGNINSTVSRTITVDGTKPHLSVTLNETELESNVSSIHLSWQTNDTNLNQTRLNVTYPNGTLLLSSSAESANVTLTPQNLTAMGTYSVRAFVNDSVGNSNESVGSFAVNDTRIPLLNISLNDSVIEQGQDSINISWSASDENLESVVFNITFPNGTLLTQTTNSSGTILYPSSVLSVNGTYLLRLEANDSAGNTNQTSRSFSINDTRAPAVSGSIPSNGTVFNHSIAAELAVNVTDNSTISRVEGQITFPNGTVEIVSLALSVGDKFNGSFTTPILNGRYEVVFSANDSFGHSNTSERTTFNISFSDADNDSLPDDTDTVHGNESDVTTTGISALNITINGTPVTGNTFTGKQDIAFHDGTTLLLNFSHNFTAQALDLSRVSLERASTYFIVNVSDQLGQNETKSLFLVDNSFVSFCAKDAEIGSISEVSSGCTGANETDFTSCLGNTTGVTINGITCRDLNGTLAVSGMNHSAVRGTVAEAAAPAPVSAGGGGGGGSGGEGCPTGTVQQGGRCLPLPRQVEEEVETEIPERVLFDLTIIIPLETLEVTTDTATLPLEIYLDKFRGEDIATSVNLSIDLFRENASFMKHNSLAGSSETISVYQEEVISLNFSLPGLVPGEHVILVRINYADNQTAVASAFFQVTERTKESLSLVFLEIGFAVIFTLCVFILLTKWQKRRTSTRMQVTDKKTGGSAMTVPGKDHLPIEKFLELEEIGREIEKQKEKWRNLP
ncbi:Ig-like domain repeat protein [Candidatus Woesearchaeota archaeon]|nr:Ig-like domain repeat protein [Candidatus Woesearchaeota archaeon]